MKSYLALFVVALIALVPMSVYGDVVAVDNLSYTLVTEEDGTKVVHMTVPTPQAPEKTVIAYVELRFEADLAEALEVELWEDTGGQTNAWDLEDRQNVRHTKWVMGADGSKQVRFDITELAQEWTNATKANNGVLIRLRPDQESKHMALKQDPKVRLLYHVLSVDD